MRSTGQPWLRISYLGLERASRSIIDKRSRHRRDSANLLIDYEEKDAQRPAMASQEEAPLPLYRPAKPLPFELRQHCGIYFEEKLCSFDPPAPARLTATKS